MAKVLARAQLPIKACNPPKLPRFTKSLSFFSCRNVSQDLNFSLDRKIYSFIGVEKMQHSYKIWEEVKVYESFWTKIRNLRYFWDHFWVSEIFANDFSQVVWDERYFYKRVTGSFGSSSLNFNDFKLTTTIYLPNDFSEVDTNLGENAWKRKGEKGREEGKGLFKRSWIGQGMVKPKTKDLFGGVNGRSENTWGERLLEISVIA